MMAGVSVAIGLVVVAAAAGPVGFVLLAVGAVALWLLG